LVMMRSHAARASSLTPRAGSSGVSPSFSITKYAR
jgi:hypothetical protein